MTTEEFTWAELDEADFKKARDTIVHALEVANLAAYYRRYGNYAGVTFTDIEPNDPYDLTASDLHAVSMLSVTVEPAATRRLLEPSMLREVVLHALAHVPVDVRLEDAKMEQLERAWNLQAALKEALAPYGANKSNCWVTASKISARKRPLLIPVRDNVVGRALGPAALKSAGVYWQLMADALRDTAVQDALVEAQKRVETCVVTGKWGSKVGTELGPVELETNPMRLIDVALWMAHAKGKAVPLEPEETVTE
ncbi:DUF6308 family protein [Demequina lutea]|uniref:Uncharacterized protein n=1 Tax=Demequina lutea TaxID=431489 RepID=A0A7Z0CL89_9MICO|nr:DUF6308 family protein [Demequina lutea]NYI42673.1 hypothetical protein [Demequina lutea]